MNAVTKYTPQDTLYLWSLVQPAEPVLVGDLKLVRSNQSVSLRYASLWLQSGFALSEDLPLIDQEFIPTDKATAVGAIDDARPDRWGEQVIRVLDKPPRLSLLEFLYFAGDDRFGALGVSIMQNEYVPRKQGPLPTLRDADQIQELVRKILANEPVPETQKRLIHPGVSLGGAKPKALIDIEGEQWVVKFSAGEPADVPLIEHATMTLASQAKIRVAETRAVRLADGHAVAIKRFDRKGKLRVHCLSAHVALRAAAERYGYPELSQLLRRRGVMTKDLYLADMHELFRRMVFNILIDNTDDHEKNHALTMTDAQHYSLAPAFDVLPSGQALGFQQMRVGDAEADSTIDNALSMAQYFGLDAKKAITEVRVVARVVDNWKKHFKAQGVTRHDIEMYATQIDRPFLCDQRREYL